MSKQSDNFRQRVIAAAETVLKYEGSVGPLELLQQMQFLATAHVKAWRRGHEAFTPLEPHIQAGEEKLQKTYRYFQEWVRAKGLRPIETRYVRSRPGGEELLQVTADGAPEREEFFRTRYAPADLSDRQAEQLERKLAKAPDLVVYQLVSPSSTCSECETELWKGELLFMEKGQPLCLVCADLDHLEFLPSGDAALTRRARKHSRLSAVVVRFSRTRKRYERQGILVEPEAIERAEEECKADAPERAERRRRDAERRLDEDQALVEEMTRAIRDLYPNCPAAEARQIAEHTALRGSGRVGRSAAGRALQSHALELAIVASVRHNHTDYDLLLMRGVDRRTARDMIRDEIDRVLRKWSSR